MLRSFNMVKSKKQSFFFIYSSQAGKGIGRGCLENLVFICPDTLLSLSLPRYQLYYLYMKNRTLFLLVAAAAVMVASCNSNPTSYTIDGTVVDSTLNGNTIYLTDIASRNVIDSVVITNNKFKFKGKADTAFVGVLQAMPYHLGLIVENGNIVVELGRTDKLSGTPLNDELYSYMNDMDSLRQVIMAKQQEIVAKGLSNEEAAEEWSKVETSFINPAIDKLYSSYFDRNKNNVMGAWVMYNWGVTPAQFDSLYNLMGDSLKANPLVKGMVHEFEMWKKTSEGQMFTDFTIEQPDGTKASLSDYVGKGRYVLVDFWASWCTPCRAEIPNIKELYDKYHDQGLDVLGVAVWDKVEDTQKAIEELGIVWPQIINAQQIPTDLYSIRGIPHIILFAPDGTIVARDLRDEAMKEKVAEVMKTVKK